MGETEKKTERFLGTQAARLKRICGRNPYHEPAAQTLRNVPGLGPLKLSVRVSVPSIVILLCPSRTERNFFQLLMHSPAGIQPRSDKTVSH
jgi:hypothetical protein